MAGAVLAATGAWADERDDEIKKLTRPDSTVEVGIGVVTDANTRFGQYNGMVDERGYLLFDGTFVRRDDATGTWLGITGRNLGLENRELRLDASRQGDWGVFIDYSQTPRYSPYTPITGLTGYDSTTQTVNGQPAQPLELKTERRGLGVGVDKWVAQRWDVRFSARQEQKTGRRLFGSGGGTAFLVDPIDYRTQLYEASVGYTGEQAQFTGGYYGTSFVNYKSRLDVIGSPSGITPIGLPPSNESHQLFFGGGYNLTKTTRATYKFSWQHQTQHADFMDVSTTGRTNLGGVVDTTFGQVGLTSRPMSGLTVVADLRREDRDDKTPVVDYFSGSSTATGVNEPRSIRATVAKLEGTYQLPARFRVTGGFDWDERRRNTSDVRVVSFREKTQENTVRIDLRRDMSETLNGSIGYAHSKRTGSEWQTTFTTTPGLLGSNLVQPLHLADRERDKLRATLGWMPADKIDLQARAEASKDEYGGRTLGLQDGSARFFSLDGGYRFAESWQLSAWISRDDTRANLLSCMSAPSNNNGDIGSCPNSAASPIWSANMRNVGTAFGLGVKGKATAQLEVGFELQIQNDRAEFNNGPTPTATPALTPPPEVSYDRQILRLTAKYAMQKNAGLRLMYTRDRFSTNDWTWAEWTYSDGTRVMANPQQTVNFFGVTGYYDF
jgi:MtrB/PioB family decaheme-associated outer membrane protein